MSGASQGLSSGAPLAAATVDLASAGKPASLTVPGTTATEAVTRRVAATATCTRPLASPVGPAVQAPAPAPALTARVAPPTATEVPSTGVPPTPSPAAPTPLPVPRLTANQNVNVRSGPGTTYPVIGGLRAGDNYGITSRNKDGSWLQLGYGGRDGWVLARLVDQAGDLARVSVAQDVLPPPTRTPAPSHSPSQAAAGPAATKLADPVLAALFDRVNKARADVGLAHLNWSTPLAAAASAHVGDITAHNYFSHTGSDGTVVTERMRRTGYMPTYWGEIMTHVQGDAEAAFDQFWKSPHHHDIMLGDEFADLGIAWSQDPQDGSFHYFAVVFGRQ